MARKRIPKNKGRNVRTEQRENAHKREILERKWYSRTEFAGEYNHLVVQHSGKEEAWHRWLPYRQGFAPELVRSFIENGELLSGPLLDPFSGSGTTVIESLRQGRPAIGVEALPALAYLTHVRLHAGTGSEECGEGSYFAESITDPPAAWQEADSDLARACVLMAAARTVKGDGKPRKNLPPFVELLEECKIIINEDMLHGFDARGTVITGDARTIPVMGQTIGGVLTSPPYLSRYDYARINRPVEELYESDIRRDRSHQVRAHHRAYKRNRTGAPHPAAEEAAASLRNSGQKKEAGVALSYIDDLQASINEISRILKPHAPMMMVIAGATFCGTYFPCDLLAAEFCEAAGMEVEEILSVRNLGPGKRLGALDEVAPREIILSARKLN